MLFDRITSDPEVLGGVPCIRGLRVPVATVVGMIADEMTPEEILADFPTSSRTTSLRRCATPRRPSASVSCRYVRWDEIPDRRGPVPVVAQELRQAGLDAVHVGDVLSLATPDAEILEHAARDTRVIVAADTDFGELLAMRQVSPPSVVLFHRQTGRRSREQAALLLANLPEVEAKLDAGAIVVVEERRLRVRALPITEPGNSRRMYSW